MARKLQLVCYLPAFMHHLHADGRQGQGMYINGLEGQLNLYATDSDAWSAKHAVQRHANAQGQAATYHCQCAS